MIHITQDLANFNIPTNIFRIDNIFKSYIYLGSIKRGEYIGPTGCNALSTDKVISVKKSFSEAIERKALMAGGYADITGHTTTFDLVQKKISKLNSKFTSYRVHSPNIIDTTGMSAHINGNKALQKSLEELLEKNALFTFWYGKKGYKLADSVYNIHPLYKRIKQEGYDILAFLSKQFPPLNTIIIILYKNNNIISSGISASLYFEKALDAAMNESYLLKWENQANNLKQNSNSFTYNDIQYLDHLSSFEEINDGSHIIQKDISINNYTEELLNCIPKWVSNLHVISLKNTTYPDLICIKLFSTDLYNHLPLKKILDLNQEVNKKTINIKDNEIEKICDCIVK